MVKEYRLTKGNKIFYCVIGILATIGGVAIITMVISDYNRMVAFFIVPIGGVFIGAGVYLLIAAFRYKVVITDNSIRLSEFGTKELLFSEILGFRTNAEYIFIFPIQKDKPVLKIGTPIGGSEEIVQWLEDNYKDFDLAEEQEEVEDFWQNEAYGATDAEKEANRQSAHHVARIFNGIGVVASLWVLIYPGPYGLAYLLCSILPFAAIIPYRRYKGLIRLEIKTAGIYPLIGLAIVVPPFGIFSRTMVDFNLLFFTPIIIPSLVIGLTFMALLVYKQPEFILSSKKGKIALVLVLVLSLVFGYGVSTFVNCQYDKSELIFYGAKIVHKKEGNKEVVCQLLDPADPYLAKPGGLNPALVTRLKTLGYISLPNGRYKNLPEGDTVFVCIRPGRLNAPWYYVVY